MAGEEKLRSLMRLGQAKDEMIEALRVRMMLGSSIEFSLPPTAGSVQTAMAAAEVVLVDACMAYISAVADVFGEIEMKPDVQARMVRCGKAKATLTASLIRATLRPIMGRTQKRRERPNTRPSRRDYREEALPFRLTEHAAEQFRDRILGPSWSLHFATKELRSLARTAAKTDFRGRHGEEVWFATDGAPVRFVVKVDGGERICVTVLAPLAPATVGDRDDENGEGLREDSGEHGTDCPVKRFA